ncbi:MAG TPA: hypothetical protein VMS11_06095 [Solirubrobacterales bacterium]|nr:hypothetical protein [Solirubrobacterales bacterium]
MARRSGGDEPEPGVPPDRLDAVYTVIANRRTAFDTLMWQVPALGLAAQAFLLTIAFGSDSSDAARYFSGGLSVVVAVVAIQTMLKHRANELTDSRILEGIERQAGIRIGDGAFPHDKPEVRGPAVGNEQINGWWEQWKSAWLWVFSLSCFALAGLAAISLTVFAPGTLSG